MTFTATVSANGPGSGTPTGTVTFQDGSTVLGTGTLDATGVATYTTGAFTACRWAATPSPPSTARRQLQRQHQRHAFRDGQSRCHHVHAVASSTSASPASYGQAVTFTATVAPTAPAAARRPARSPSRTGRTVLGTGTLNARERPPTPPAPSRSPWAATPSPPSTARTATTAPAPAARSRDGQSRRHQHGAGLLRQPGSPTARR